MPEMIGKKIGQYEITAEIGRGGMAAIYRATQGSIGREVAVKFLHKSLIEQDPTFLERFYREVKIAASLQHPHILPVHDYGEYEDQPYIVMSYLAGGTLGEHIAREKQLQTHEAARFVGQIAGALDYAHEQGIIHRDLKPDNILLDEAGNAYLADFGLAKAVQSTQLTNSGIVGTPNYLAPDLANGGEVTAAADIYSLGVCLYQMLSGELPFSSESPMGVLLAHANNPVPDIREARPDLPGGVQYAILKAMAKDAEDRFKKAGELVEALQAAVEETDSVLYIHLFGSLRLFSLGEPLPFSTLPKTLPLLAYLLLYRKTSIPRDTLAFTFWPDVAEKEARSNLRRHLHNLGKALPEADKPWIVRQSGTVQWNPEAPYWLDVAAFEHFCADPERLEDAVALYTDDLLPEVYDDWLSFERKRLENSYAQSLSTLSEKYRQQGDHEQALELNQRLLRQDPWREDVIREIMTLRYLMGDRAGALKEYQQFQEALHAELEVPPMPETEALYETLQRGELTPEKKEGAPEAGGESEEQPYPSVNQIPTPVRPIIGREEEIAALLELIGGAQPPTRLLTLIGPGGVGKTRLAVEVANRLSDSHAEHFPDGIIFIKLSALTDHTLVLPTLAEMLGVQVSGGQVQKAVIENLRYRKILLVLDNFEHLIAAAPEIAGLLAAAPGLRVLVTSQMRLNLYGEQEFIVPALGLPVLHPNTSLDELRTASAVRLFEERARSLSPQFSLDEKNALTIVEICAQLDGLPLALELAATRVRMHPPEGILSQLADRLDFLVTRAHDVPERHRNLRAALEWSVDLLEPREKALFTQLAVFRGGFSAEAVQGVLMAEKNLAQTLNALELLEEKSIIQVETLSSVEGQRFLMPTALRVYARELLQADPELPALKLRFIQYHADEFEGAYKGFQGGEQKEWLARIRLEINNLRTALEWAFEPPGDAERVLLGAKILRWIQMFWPAKGKCREGLAWVEKALTHQEKFSDKDIESTLFYLGGNYSGYLGNFAEAQTYTEEGLRLARELGNSRAICVGLIFLSVVVGRQGDYQQSAGLLREALEMERTNNPGETTHTLGVITNNLGLVLKNLGDYEGAAAMLEETLAIDEEKGNRMGTAAGLTNKGDLAILQEDFKSARECYRQALEIRQELRDAFGIIKSLTGMGNLAIAQEQFEHGAQLYAANLKLRQQMNFPIPPEAQRQVTSHLNRIREALPPEDFEAAWAAGEAMTRDEVVAYALEG